MTSKSGGALLVILAALVCAPHATAQTATPSSTAPLTATAPTTANTLDNGNDPNDPQTWFKDACPRCGVLAYLDIPTTSTTVSRADLLAGNAAFQGWGFECVGGDPVDRVDIYVETDVLDPYGDYLWRPLKQAPWTLSHGQIYRPDVVTAFKGACPNVSPLTGFSQTVTNWPDWAMGARRVRLVVWRGPYHVALTRTYNIVD